MIKPQIVNKLKSINELNLLMLLEDEKDGWMHDKESREYLAERFNIAEITVKKCLKSLVNKGYLYKISKGIYKINKEVLQ